MVTQYQGVRFVIFWYLFCFLFCVYATVVMPRARNMAIGTQARYGNFHAKGTNASKSNCFIANLHSLALPVTHAVSEGTGKRLLDWLIEKKQHYTTEKEGFFAACFSKCFF